MQMIARSFIMLSVVMFFLNPASQNKPIFGEVSISKNSLLRFVCSIIVFYSK